MCGCGLDVATIMTVTIYVPGLQTVVDCCCFFVGQMVPNQRLLQAWTLASLSPAQQQQFARNNQLTYQQLLAQQYLFQQAMLRNPQALLQAQSIRMAQLQQLQKQHQQQQRVLAAAGLAAGIGATTSSGSSATPSIGMSNSQNTSKLLVTMARNNSTALPGSVASATTSGTQSGSKFMGTQSTVGGGSGLKSGSKSRQNVTTNNGMKGQPPLPAIGTRVSGQTVGGSNAIGHSKATSQVMNAGQQNSTSRTGGETRHYSRNSKTSSKSKTGGVAYSSSSSSPSSDKKSRQK